MLTRWSTVANHFSDTSSLIGGLRSCCCCCFYYCCSCSCLWLVCGLLKTLPGKGKTPTSKLKRTDLVVPASLVLAEPILNLGRLGVSYQIDSIKSIISKYFKHSILSKKICCFNIFDSIVDHIIAHSNSKLCQSLYCWTKCQCKIS